MVIPIAYYLFKRNLDEGYLTAVAHQEDRERIRGWVCRTLVKAGVWGSGLDTLLLALRAAILESGHDQFPIDAIEAAMAKRGKALVFTEDEFKDLLDCAYGEKRTFALLALLYPFVDLRNVFHVDHIFPKSHFTPKKLRAAVVQEEKIGEYIDKSNRLSNLQLLEGAENKSKQDKIPATWLQERYPDAAQRANFCELHDLGDVPEGLIGFEKFYSARRERVSTKLRDVLSIDATVYGSENGEE